MEVERIIRGSDGWRAGGIEGLETVRGLCGRGRGIGGVSGGSSGSGADSIWCKINIVHDDEEKIIPSLTGGVCSS